MLVLEVGQILRSKFKQQNLSTTLDTERDAKSVQTECIWSRK